MNGVVELATKLKNYQSNKPCINTKKYTLIFIPVVIMTRSLNTCGNLWSFIYDSVISSNLIRAVLYLNKVEQRKYDPQFKIS